MYQYFTLVFGDIIDVDVYNVELSTVKGTCCGFDYNFMDTQKRVCCNVWLRFIVDGKTVFHVRRLLMRFANIRSSESVSLFFMFQ